MVSTKVVALVTLLAMIAGASLIPAIGAIVDRDKEGFNPFIPFVVTVMMGLSYVGTVAIVYALLTASLVA